ncbi:MAG TPA: hypothetical protein VGJ13_04370 [Pseudonocardiaceae bacterium]
MNDGLGTYVVVLVLGIGSALLVGQVLLRTGQAILEEAFEQRVANSVNRLLCVLFHLGALGVLALISTVDVPVTGAVQTVVTKFGIVLLLLGLAHGLLILMLTRLRNRSREQGVLDSRNFRLDVTGRQAATDPAPVQGPVVGIGQGTPR